MFSNIGLPEILLIIVVIVLLFGAKRLPDAARSLGRSMRIFKSEVKEMSNDSEQQAVTPPAQQSIDAGQWQPQQNQWQPQQQAQPYPPQQGQGYQQNPQQPQGYPQNPQQPPYGQQPGQPGPMGQQ